MAIYESFLKEEETRTYGHTHTHKHTQRLLDLRRVTLGKIKVYRSFFNSFEPDFAADRDIALWLG